MTDLRQKLTDRLALLQREMDLGEDRLRTLENEVVVIRQTLLRITGAMQVLRELMDETTAADADAGRGETITTG